MGFFEDFGKEYEEFEKDFNSIYKAWKQNYINGRMSNKEVHAHMERIIQKYGRRRVSRKWFDRNGGILPGRLTFAFDKQIVKSKIREVVK